MLLDDIDTASDMFKPKWCKYTQPVNQLQQLRWLYCTSETEKDKSGNMVINGECFKKKTASYWIYSSIVANGCVYA